MPRDAGTGRFVPGTPTPAEKAAIRAGGGYGPNSGSFGAPGNPGGNPIAPLGATRLDSKSGEVLVKTSMASPYRGRTYTRDGRSYTLNRTGHWKPRRVVVFEAAHGPVPPGCMVRRVMPDPLDDSLENLVLITKRVNALLNSGHWTKPRQRWSNVPPDRELRLAVIAAAVAVEMTTSKREGAA